MRIARWIRDNKFAVLVVGPVLGMLAAVLLLNFAMPEKRIKHSLRPHHGITDPQFRHELATLLGPPLVEVNSAANLEYADEIFPRMLEAIAGAERTMSFESYIRWSGEIGGRCSQAVSERARDGVKVHVVLDWISSQKID